MAPVSDRGGGRSKGRELSLDDCRCPVCLEIFMEPVTLPCTHTFCKECFLETVDKATLCCPMCRKRVSTWARLNSRNNTLVDQQLWTHIQTAFPLQCQRRLSGQDAITEDDPGASVCFPRVSQPGELKREYEDQVTKLTEEKRAMEEEEQRASEEYIRRLLAEEEELLQEERRRREDDERLARLLSNQLNSNPVSQDNLSPADVTPAKKKKKKDVSGGQMDKFLCPLPSNNSSSSFLSSRCSFVSNKENIMVSQVELQVERPLPNLDYYGPQRDRSEPPSVSVDDQLHPGTHRSHMTGDKRKSSELDMTEDEKETVTKRGSLLPPSPSSSSSSSSLQVEVLQGDSEWEVEQLRRRQQEEDDRRLALLLQKELDQEEKQRATDRRKDSSDPYLLRPNSRGKVEATSSSRTSPTSSSKTCSTSPSTRTSTPSSKTTSSTTTPTTSSKTSSASSSRTSSTPSTSSSRTSSTSSSRGSKQATLTEMFSSLIS
uniref:E3 ubiquitin-protein ligase rnf168 n=1 Tax=Epinephelus lanceolatus TaxID=310571 RepID=UPI00144815EC|nr:E3 ubiquitin-protein ligase rnf168 [Epinephelus lanceolatus]